MRVLIISDTHKYLRNFASVLKKEGSPDMLLHLGDVCGQDEDIEEMADCWCEFVSGNNDIFSALPDEKDIMLGNYRVHMEHGHCLPYDIRGIRDYARRIGADVMLSGHTHMPVLDYEDGIWVINPGSLSLPRQIGRTPTYIVANVDSAGEISFELRYLED